MPDRTADEPAVEPPSFNLDVEAPAFWESPYRKLLCVITLGGNAIDPPATEDTFEAQMAPSNPPRPRLST